MATSNKEEDAQHSAADALQRQIDALVKGEKPDRGERPASFRDFVSDKMAEDAAPETPQKK